MIARFENERQSLALMNHPNIAQIFDAGITEDDRPYFAMEYIKNGIPINEYCDKKNLKLKERLEIFINDLDWIILKCLEKEREKRYNSVNDLVLDINRYLNNEPVLARKKDLFYITKKFIKRHKISLINFSIIFFH